MKIHQRLYAVRPPRPLAPPTSPSAAAVASSSSSSRARSPSSPTVSSSRSLHTLGPLSFFDSPPTPPSSRPSSSNLVVSSRLTVEVKAEFESHSTNSPYSQPSQNSSSHSHSHPSGSGGPPYPLAFTSSQSDTAPSHFHPYASHHNFFPYPALGPFPAQDTHPSGWVDPTESTASQLESEERVETRRYHLDVGAYGIPKHVARDSRVAGPDGRPPSAAYPTTSAHQNLLSQAPDAAGNTNNNGRPSTRAVLVGEDAYFVRDNAMGVADGVGGWARVNKNARVDGSSPSALFAQRLMSYCSEEVDAAMLQPQSDAQPLEVHQDRLQDELEDELEELEDGLDVLMILERAYDRVMKLHTQDPLHPNSTTKTQHSRTGSPSLAESSESSTVLGSSFSPSSTGESHRTPHSPQNPHSADSSSNTLTCSSSLSSPSSPSSLSASNLSSSFPIQGSSLPTTPTPPSPIQGPSLVSSSSSSSSPIQVTSSPTPVMPPPIGYSSRSGLTTSDLTPSSSVKPPSRNFKKEKERERNPLLQGSATALLAVLDHTYSRSGHARSTHSHSNHAHSNQPNHSTPSAYDSPKHEGLSGFEKMIKGGLGRGAGVGVGGASSSSSVVMFPKVRYGEKRMNGMVWNEERDGERKSEVSGFGNGNVHGMSSSSSSTPRAATTAATATTSATTTIGGGKRKEECGGGGAVMRIAHLGDCMGMLIRGEEVVWRTEEMWWNFNTPVQLGPLSSTKPHDAKVFTVPVEADDILVLASDGLSDNLWDEDILDEVVRFKRRFMPGGSFSANLESACACASLTNSTPTSTTPSTTMTGGGGGKKENLLGRRTLAGMLSEALCSRARAVSERRGVRRAKTRRSDTPTPTPTPSSGGTGASGAGVTSKLELEREEDEVPFARRAREQGKVFKGGKLDDISVLIAVVSPVENSKIECGR